jgi:hypothetical protein
MDVSCASALMHGATRPQIRVQPCCFAFFLMPSSLEPPPVASMNPDESQRVRIAFTPQLGRTRNTRGSVLVRFTVPSIHARAPMVDTGNAPASASPAVNANDLPREALKLDKFEGKTSDRRYAASWLQRNERIQELLGYGDSDLTKKFALASSALPSTSGAGRWFDSQQNTASTRFASWDSFKTRFLQRFGPTPQDLLKYEQDFQRLSQGKSTVGEFVQRIDTERDFLAACGRTFDDTSVRNILIGGLRKSIAQHVSSTLCAKPDANYDTCVQFALSHVDADSRDTGRLATFQHDKSRDDSVKRCAYHKGTSGHTTDECRVVKQLKAKGLWGKDKNKPKK